MTLSRTIRASGILLITLLALGITLWGNQRLAQADLPPPGFGAQIVCIVFTDLNDIGAPIPFLETEGCPDGGEEVPACQDEIDNDGDGLIDFPADPGCSSADDESEVNSGPAQCSNDEDDDGDGFTDENDPNCHTDGNPSNSSSYDPNDNSESGTLPACWNGVDDDEDGKTDYPADPGCASPVDTDETDPSPGGGGGGGGVENTLPLCSDGLDNDSDSLVDLEDPDCVSFKPSLTVKKLVNNVDGGTATSSDFTIHVMASSSNQSFFGSASGTQMILTVGAFAVTETGGPSGYVVATSTNCAGILVVGDAKTCTLTNTYSTTTADVSVAKDADVITPQPGATVTYTLTAANSGPNVAASTTVVDLLPSGLTYVSDDATTTGSTYATSTGVWMIGTLASGSSTALHIIATVNAGTEGQTIENIATITSNKPDSNTGNNTGSETVTPPSSSGGGGDNSGGGGGGGGGGGSGSAIATQVNPALGGGGSSQGQVLGLATGGPTTTCDAYLIGFLRIGYQNDPEQVRKLQLFLNEEMASGLPITGFFGPLTDAAVRAFQARYASEILAPWDITEPTGYVYLTTRKKINELNCARSFPLTPAEQAIIDWSRQTGAILGTSASSQTSADEEPPPSSGAITENDGEGALSDDEKGTSTPWTLNIGENQYGVVGILLLILLALGGGWYYWQSRNKSATSERA